MKYVQHTNTNAETLVETLGPFPPQESSGYDVHACNEDISLYFITCNEDISLYIITSVQDEPIILVHLDT